MTLLVAGCSFSSGWGFDNQSNTWAHQLAQKLDLPLINVAQTSSSNQDIFLSVMKSKSNLHSKIIVQWTALNRITVSPSPVNPKVILSHHNQLLEQSLSHISSREIDKFVKIFIMLNQDWKHFFDLVDMIEILQQDSRVYFVNGLLPWNQDFFERSWSIPLDIKNGFLEFLLQSEQFDDQQLSKSLSSVLQARDRIDQSRWVNLTDSWDSFKLDTVSSVDQHPGPLSQIYYADQIYNFIKGKTCQI